MNKSTQFFLLTLIFILSVSCSPFAEYSFYQAFGQSEVIINDKGSTTLLNETETIDWTVADETASRVASYEVSLGSQIKLSDVVDWVDVGMSTSYKFKKELQPDTMYYVNIRYVLANGTKSEIFSSQGFKTPKNGAEKIEASQRHVCVVNKAGKLKCWGDNSFGQLGYDDTYNRGSYVNGTTQLSMTSLTYVNVGIGRTVKSLSVGSFHTCVILDNDQLKCWGRNSSGQLGYEDNLSRGHIPGSMASLNYINLGLGRTAKQVIAGGNNTCVILDNDQLKCWGANNYYQNGYGLGPNIGTTFGSITNLPYVNFGPGRTVKKVAVSGNKTCVILDNDELKCWGYGYYDLGYEDTAPRGVSGVQSLAAVNVGSGRKAKDVKMNGGILGSTCVILDNDQMKCWGSNSSGMLGYNDPAPKGYDSSCPGGVGSGSCLADLGYVDIGAGRSVKSMRINGTSSCAILDNDQLKCWGNNFFGQLGYDDTDNRGDSLNEMQTLDYVNFGFSRKVTAVAISSTFTCAILDQSDVKCWGDNSFGQLGYDDNEPRSITSKSTALVSSLNFGLNRHVKSIEAGESHTCVILDNNKLKCWGLNNVGQLGYDDTLNRGDTMGSLATLGEVNLGLGRTAQAVYLGANHTCAILDNDQLKCWGDNSSGQLGYDDTNYRGNSFGSMNALNGVFLGMGRTVKSLALGYSHTCAVLDNNQIKCWGDNSFGQLGYDDTINRGASLGSMMLLNEVDLGPTRFAKAVRAGGNHTCAVLDNDQLKCWGENTSANVSLGYGNSVAYGSFAGSMSSLGYVNLGAGRTVKDVRLGESHICALLDNDEFKCWGEGGEGRTGHSMGAPLNAPSANISLGENLKPKSLSLGYTHSCVILENNQMKCFGANYSSQIGSDDGDHRGQSISVAATRPVSLGIDRSVQSVATGGHHTCALLDTNQVKCWGLNSSGQLGYDDIITRGNLGKSIRDDKSNLYFP